MINNLIFISYAHQDVAFVAQLSQHLIELGYNTWFDQSNITLDTPNKATSRLKSVSKIVENIKHCRVFLLILSQNSITAPDVQKQIDTAQYYQKQIITLIWQDTDVPATLAYQLVGNQWLDFGGLASKENFQNLVSHLPIPPTVKTDTTKSPDNYEIIQPTANPKAPTIDLSHLKHLISSKLVTVTVLNIENRAAINQELAWLFAALDHLFKLNRNQITLDQYIDKPIPPEAYKVASANNTLRCSRSTAKNLEIKIKEHLNDIKQYLERLDSLMERQETIIEEGVLNPNLERQITLYRIELSKNLKTLAEIIGDENAYGIRITAPSQLIQLLENIQQ